MIKEDRNSMANSKPADDPFAAQYPNLVFWVKGGWVEIARNDYSQSCVRALDDGGLVWEGEADYSSFYEALQALEAGIAAWRGWQGC